MKAAAAVAAILAVVAAVFVVQTRRANLTVGELIAGPAPFNLSRELEAGRSMAHGPRIDFLSPRPVGAVIVLENDGRQAFTTRVDRRSRGSSVGCACRIDHRADLKPHREPRSDVAAVRACRRVRSPCV